MRRRTFIASGATAAAAAAAGAGTWWVLADGSPHEASVPVVPKVRSFTAGDGEPYRITAETSVHVEGGGAEAKRTARLMGRALGLPVREGGGILLRLDPGADGVEGDGYLLVADARAVTITARTGAGLFAGTQTLRQLLPPKVEFGASVPPCRIEDAPRYPYRGVLFDVARHFFTVDEVKRVIDLAALHKLNRLHLHLTDDQGWRLEIPGLPRLTTVGAATEVGGTPGGFYTADDYRTLVEYAAERYLTVVPEIDMPGHTQAALVSYPDLACPGTPTPRPYTGVKVGFSSLCTDSERTYAFVEKVVAAVAELTPGPYLHIGGDEAKTLEHEAYAAFMRRAARIVRDHGKEPMAWNEAAAVSDSGLSVLQFWDSRVGGKAFVDAVQAGAKAVMSPADRTYLDQKYDAGTELGADWAGHVTARDAYDWDPAHYFKGMPADAVMGVEAALWTETIATTADADRMLLPRLAAVAEVGWADAGRDWDAFRRRLVAQFPRWKAAGYGWTELR
ncbi:family 20 glycosylhydrolase [Streptomyces sp. T-3]|nr:family 20 glycosylhydrolase [Streptomyces sp. T-3]